MLNDLMKKNPKVAKAVEQAALQQARAASAGAKASAAVSSGVAETAAAVAPKSKGFGLLSKVLKGNPVAAGAGLIGGAAFLANTFRNNREERALEEEMGFDLEGITEARSNSRYQQLRAERIQQMQSANIERLARLQPELYNQVVAGRRLPEGGVAIGGVPRLDMLQQIASAMGEMGQRVPGSVMRDVLFPEDQQIFEE